jgi:plastocyanin
MTRLFTAAAVAASAAFAIAACGGSSSTGPSSPTTTVTIANNTVSPKNIQVMRGTQVTFINNDAQSHNMTSNPHPEHTDCPEINSVGLINPGQTKRTDNMTTNRAVCGFHDHDRPDVAGLQGSITIQ